MTALSDARAELAKLEAQRVAYVKAIAEAKTAREPVQKRYDTNLAARKRHRIIVNAANAFHVTTEASVGVTSWDTRQLVGMKPAAIREAIAAGKFSVALAGSGITYKARGMSQRIRVPHPEDLRAYERAQKVTDRARHALERAKAAQATACQLAYDNGDKVPFDDLVATLTKDAAINAALDAVRDTTDHAGKLNSMLDPMFGSLPRAQSHYDHLVKKDADPECVTCKLIASTTEKRAVFEARITALPRRKFTCPTHGKKLGHFERGRDDWYNGRLVHDLPLIWCPIDFTRFVHSPTLAEDQAKKGAAA
jgi:hypothetical protein